MEVPYSHLNRLEQRQAPKHTEGQVKQNGPIHILLVACVFVAIFFIFIAIISAWTTLVAISHVVVMAVGAFAISLLLIALYAIFLVTDRYRRETAARIYLMTAAPPPPQTNNHYGATQAATRAAGNPTTSRTPTSDAIHWSEMLQALEQTNNGL